MFNFHKHNWVKIKETYAPPFKGKITADMETLQKLTFGVTTLLWECSICKAIKKEEMLGETK